jgi:hypothetical protein
MWISSTSSNRFLAAWAAKKSLRRQARDCLANRPDADQEDPHPTPRYS